MQTNGRRHYACLPKFHKFLPRCMECRRGLAMRILSVRLSVCLSVCPFVKRVICDKWKKDRSRLSYHTKDHLA